MSTNELIIIVVFSPERVVDVGQVDARTLMDKGTSDRRSNASRRSGNEGNFAFQSFHCVSLAPVRSDWRVEYSIVTPNG